MTSYRLNVHMAALCTNRLLNLHPVCGVNVLLNNEQRQVTVLSSMFCCTLLYVHSSIAIILMVKRELIALLNLSSWCLVMVKRLFLAVPRGCLQFVIVVFPDHTHLLFLYYKCPIFTVKSIVKKSL